MLEVKQRNRFFLENVRTTRQLACKHLLKELADYLDGSLKAEVRTQLEAHLAKCPNCWVLCDTAKKTIQVLRNGSEHPSLATTLDNLAVLYRSQGNYPQAEALYRRSRAIAENILGREYPRLATMLESYADLLRKTGRRTEAARIEARARTIRAQHEQGRQRQAGT